MVGQVLPSEGSLRPVGGEEAEIGDEMIVHDDFLAERMAYHLKRGRDLLERSR